MDITPNMTTVIQMINFGIAYGMIRVFLCKPVIDLLQKEEEKINRLSNEITTHTNLIGTTKDSLYHQWQIRHQFFVNNRPVIDNTLPFFNQGLSVDVQQLMPQKQDVDSISRTLADSLVEKVLHGNK